MYTFHSLCSKVVNINMYKMHVNDIQVTKIPKRVLDLKPRSLKAKCKTLKVGESLPVNSLGWANNLQTMLNESTDLQFKAYTEPQISYYKYSKLPKEDRNKYKAYIGRIA